tara:strand:+ start:226 stop:447 length:222 start_codon:yes stop_codon:yes gene_type:complete
MKNQITLSEINNRIFELKNKIYQAQNQAPTEVHTHSGVTMFGTSLNLEDIWSDEEMNEFSNLCELKESLENSK